MKLHQGISLVAVVLFTQALPGQQTFAPGATSGSLWSAGGPLADLARDPRANQLGDIVTILVSENVSASATGTTNSARKSSTTNSITSLLGPTKATGPLAQLAGVAGNTQLQGQGTTSRQATFTTTLSARVAKVLPNGFLAVEGVKEVTVNSEKQLVTVTGVVRPIDINPDNTVQSFRLSQLEVRINGKGVVADSVRRPNILYRLLLGVLPF